MTSITSITDGLLNLISLMALKNSASARTGTSTSTSTFIVAHHACPPRRRRRDRGKRETTKSQLGAVQCGRRQAASIASISLLASAAAASLSLPSQALAQDEQDIRRAYFGAGDSEQLAPFFRDLIYRGVKTATTGVADGNFEVVCVEYDQKRTPFSDLLRVYFRRVNAADGKGQFKERGDRFAPIIYNPDSEALMESKKVLQLLGESGIYGDNQQQIVAPLPVNLVLGLPETFEENANQKNLKGDALKKALKKSGRYAFFDDARTGLWGYESYCKNNVCGYYTAAPKCVGSCRKYYPEGSLGLGSQSALVNPALSLRKKD